MQPEAVPLGTPARLPRHSRASGNLGLYGSAAPTQRDLRERWIPGQARNDGGGRPDIFRKYTSHVLEGCRKAARWVPPCISGERGEPRTLFSDNIGLRSANPTYLITAQ